jgi:hypothetical protein
MVFCLGIVNIILSTDSGPEQSTVAGMCACNGERLLKTKFLSKTRCYHSKLHHSHRYVGVQPKKYATYCPSVFLNTHLYGSVYCELVLSASTGRQRHGITIYKNSRKLSHVLDIRQRISIHYNKISAVTRG